MSEPIEFMRRTDCPRCGEGTVEVTLNFPTHGGSDWIIVAFVSDCPSCGRLPGETQKQLIEEADAFFSKEFLSRIEPEPQFDTLEERDLYYGEPDV